VQVHLGDGLSEWMAQLFGDGRDLRADFGSDVSFDEVVDLVKACQRADLRFREFDGIVDKKLLCELDDRSVHGVDIDPRCTQIAQLALWMRVQRAYRDVSIARVDRPLIRRSNVVIADPRGCSTRRHAP